MQPLGLYLSVPFCKAKCSYCNFASDAFGPAKMDAYVDRLCGEIAGARSRGQEMGAFLPDEVDSIYFGGGTPSLLSAEHFRRIFDAIRGEFAVKAGTEFTLECAPGQLEDATLEELLRNGLNRVSLGVQSFVDQEARAVGRYHTRDICFGEIDRLRAVGVDEINVDLIAGLPHQTRESWRQSLEDVIEIAVPHVSIYMLEVDEDSRLGREVMAGGVRYHAHHVPDDALVAELYNEACGYLNVNGIPQYEISNFAEVGHESRHNLKYWKRLPYLGLGLDAHSMIDDLRFQNTDDLDSYIAGAIPPEPTRVTKEEAFDEAIFLGLRLNAGLLLNELAYKADGARVDNLRPVLEQLAHDGLIEFRHGWAALTPRGRLLSNDVFTELLSADAS